MRAALALLALAAVMIAAIAFVARLNKRNARKCLFCINGKHDQCTGSFWDLEWSQIACRCECHREAS
jgi:hypothetical protein